MVHFFQIEYVGPIEDPMLEGYSALSYLAEVTERAKLGTLVTAVIYRLPESCPGGEGCRWTFTATRRGAPQRRRRKNENILMLL